MEWFEAHQGLLAIFITIVIALLSFLYKVWERSHSDLKIIKATYGKNDLKADITKQLNRRIKHGYLKTPVTNNIPGSDPAPHETKILRLVYWYKGKRHRREFIEAIDEIDLP